ncbi:MAG: alcohol dehydrogenase [Acidobacteria bacterium]|nr:MAG: alcohol dehydrogenase [Acidobacteriota bacterium]
MLRAIMTRPGEIQFQDVPTPAIDEREVLVRIRRIGICGSDIHVYHGAHPYTSYPVIQGHEFSGEVVKVGEQVKSVHVGDLVTAPPQIVCGTCFHCRRGQSHICDHLKVMGFQAPGVAQEFVVFPEDALLKLPSEFTPELGALVEPTSVAVHALRRADLSPGMRVLVLGAGPIGNLVAQVARWRGAAEVIITDINDHRLDVARACGIEHTVNVRQQSLEDDLERIFGPQRADLILECVGSEETANQAIRCARKGSTIVIVGVYGEIPKVDLGLVQDHELHLVGSLMYQREDYVAAIEGLASGAIVSAPLLSRTFPFRQFPDAYRFIETTRAQVMKVMIDLDSVDE